MRRRLLRPVLYGAMIDKSQIQRVLDRIQAAEAAMSDPAVLGNAKVYREKVREHAMLRKLESAAQAYFRLLDEREGNRELAGEEIVEGVVKTEPRLHRGKGRRATAKSVERLAELSRLGPVLGVVDHDIFAARE